MTDEDAHLAHVSQTRTCCGTVRCKTDKRWQYNEAVYGFSSCCVAQNSNGMFRNSISMLTLKGEQIERAGRLRGQSKVGRGTEAHGFTSVSTDVFSVTLCALFCTCKWCSRTTWACRIPDSGACSDGCGSCRSGRSCRTQIGSPLKLEISKTFHFTLTGA